MTKERIKRIYGIALSAVIVITGSLMMIACYGIYRSGDQPYSRESVAAAFSQIAVPVYLCLVLVIGGFILWLILPDDIKKVKPNRQTALILQRLQAKTDLDGCDESLRREILAQRTGRRRLRAMTAVLLALGTVIFLIYGLNRDHFPQENINGAVIRAMYVLFPCMAVPFACAIFTVYRSKASMEKEITLLKQAHSPASQPESPTQPTSNDLLPVIRFAAVIAGVILVLYGIFTGGTADVLAKAINICTECVGLG